MTDTPRVPDQVRAAAEALAEKYTSALKGNPKWDRKGSDDETVNPYMIPAEMEERFRQGAFVTFTADDGHLSFRPASLMEIAQTLADAGLLGDTRELEAEAEHLRSELAGMSDMAAKTRDFNARQFETLHSMILKAIGMDESATWPGNEAAAQALGKLGDVKALRRELASANEAKTEWHRAAIAATQGVPQWYRERDEARRELAKLCEDIRTIVDDSAYRESDALQDIRALVDREPVPVAEPKAECPDYSCAYSFTGEHLPEQLWQHIEEVHGGRRTLAVAKVQRQPWRETASLVDDEEGDRD